MEMDPVPDLSTLRVSLVSNSPTGYVPSGKTPEQVIESCNDLIASEIALPGGWSPVLFYEDLRKYPSQSKTLLAENIAERVRMPNASYLRFFEKTRGIPHPLLAQNPQLQTQVQRIFDVFTNGSVMLYFEDFFLKMCFLDRPINQAENIILLYVDALSKSPITQWNDIVRKIGCCRFEYFAKEPELYSQLLVNRKSSGLINNPKPEMMADFDLLAGMNTEASSPTQILFRAPTDGSRSLLIQNYLNKHPAASLNH